MKNLLILLLFIFGFTTASFAQNFAQNVQSQEVTRLPVLAFDAQGGATPYRLGLATGLQRTLNVIDGVYVPPVGDTLLVAQRFEDQGTLSPDVFAEAYNASTIISGIVTATGSQAQVQLIFAGPDYGEPTIITVNAPLGEPQQVLTSVANTVISELGLSVSAEDRAQIDAVLAQTPPLSTLSAVAEASLGLQTGNPTSLEALTGGLELDFVRTSRGADPSGRTRRRLGRLAPRHSSRPRRHRSARGKRRSSPSEWRQRHRATGV